MAVQRLFGEARYQDGFRLVLGCPNDRYPNGDKVCQAVGQMWTRIGVWTRVDILPGSTYFSRVNLAGSSGRASVLDTVQAFIAETLGLPSAGPTQAASGLDHPAR